MFTSAHYWFIKQCDLQIQLKINKNKTDKEEKILEIWNKISCICYRLN